MKKHGLVALSLMVLTMPATAETVYTWTAEDGSTVFSDSPPPADVDAREFTPSVPTVVDQDRVQRSRLLRQSREIGRRTDEKIKRRENVQRDLQDANKALEDARAALESGRAPLPGERRRNAGGGTRLSEAYFERVKGLERRVAEAEARVAELNDQLQRLRR